MGKKKKTPKHKGYEEMKDTPWITQARDIAQRGGQGIIDNYNRVNLFDDATREDINSRNNAVYSRAYSNMDREYRNILNKYNASNYNRFGTLNSTPSSYITDEYNRDFQRRLNDLAYNEAINYDTLMDKELARRYQTLNMFGNMYGYGATPYQQDVNNWNIKNTNKDIAYKNAVAQAQNSGGGFLQGAINGAMMGAMTGNPWAIAGGAVLGGVGGSL